MPNNTITVIHTLNEDEVKAIFISYEEIRSKYTLVNFSLMLSSSPDYHYVTFFEKSDKFKRGGGGKSIEVLISKDTYKVLSIKEHLNR